MKRRWQAACAGLLGTLGAATAHADEAAHAVPVWTLLFSTVNLLLFLWVLARYVMPAVRAWVRQRREHVVAALAAAAAAKAEAERLRAEAEQRLAAIEETIRQLRAQARADAERERERILAAAQQAAEGIRKNAERAAAYELRRTQQLLRAELVRQALQLAEAAARAHWSAADQQRCVAEFLKQVQA